MCGPARSSRGWPPGDTAFVCLRGWVLVAGEVFLIGGDSGVGSSTLLLQSLAALSLTLKALDVSGEESAEQLALRAQRLHHVAAVAIGKADLHDQNIG